MNQPSPNPSGGSPASVPGSPASAPGSLASVPGGESASVPDGGPASVPGSPASVPDGEPASVPGGGPVRELAEIPAIEVITRACVMLMSAAAEKLGLAEDGARYLDLDEARRLIDALAGLLAAAHADLGVHRQPLRDGLRSLQAAFREASPYPDPPGEGPGERSLR